MIKNNDHKGIEFPLMNIFLLGMAIIGGLAAIVIVFWFWPQSIARQVVTVSGLLLLIGLIVAKDKVFVLSCGLILFSQFQISLHSFMLTTPAVLQIYLADVILFLLLLSSLEGKFLGRMDLLGWEWMSFILWCLVSTYYSAHNAQSLVYVFRFCALLFVYVIFLHFPVNDKFIKAFYYIVSIIVIMQGLTAIAQYIHGGALGLNILGEFPERSTNYISKSIRIFGTLGGTNSFAGYMSMMLILVMCAVLIFREPIFIIALGIGALALLLSFSRAGWLSLAVGTGILCLQLVRHKYMAFSRLALSLFFIMLLGLILFITFQSRIISRFTSRVAISSVQSRLTLTREGIEAAKEYPITGIGPGITEYFGRWNDKRRYINKKLPTIKMENQVHNGHLQILMETGVPGFIIWVGIVLLTFWGAIKRLGGKGKLSELLGPFRIAAAVSAFSFLIHISFGPEINNYRIFMLYWIFIGLSRNMTYFDEFNHKIVG